MPEMTIAQRVTLFVLIGLLLAVFSHIGLSMRSSAQCQARVERCDGQLQSYHYDAGYFGYCTCEVTCKE